MLVVCTAFLIDEVLVVVYGFVSCRMNRTSRFHEQVGESGAVVASAIEGSRSFMIEVQALVCHTYFNMPRRTAAGTDYNRVNLLIAVLEKRLGLRMSDSDAYVNVAGSVMRIPPGTFT